jgi:hypothetical protein
LFLGKNLSVVNEPFITAQIPVSMIDRFPSPGDLKSQQPVYIFESSYKQTPTRKREKDIIRMVTGCVKKAVGFPAALPV